MSDVESMNVGTGWKVKNYSTQLPELSSLSLQRQVQRTVSQVPMAPLSVSRVVCVEHNKSLLAEVESLRYTMIHLGPSITRHTCSFQEASILQVTSKSMQKNQTPFRQLRLQQIPCFCEDDNGPRVAVMAVATNHQVQRVSRATHRVARFG